MEIGLRFAQPICFAGSISDQRLCKYERTTVIIKAPSSSNTLIIYKQKGSKASASSCADLTFNSSKAPISPNLLSNYSEVKNKMAGAVTFAWLF